MNKEMCKVMMMVVNSSCKLFNKLKYYIIKWNKFKKILIKMKILSNYLSLKFTKFIKTVKSKWN